MSNAALLKVECFCEEDEKTFSEYEKREQQEKKINLKKWKKQNIHHWHSIIQTLEFSDQYINSIFVLHINKFIWKRVHE